MSILILYKNISHPLADTAHAGESSSALGEQDKKKQHWLLLLVYCICTVVGIGGPFSQRIYYAHGGTLKWLQSFLESIGFVLTVPPIFVFYFKSKLPANVFFLDPKLALSCAIIGLVYGLANFMYSTGLSSIPVSTSALLFSTSLAFVAFFAFILVRQKFTFYSLNAILVITFSAIVLSLNTNSDRPAGVSKGKYMTGFFFTLGAAALGGLTSPLIELAFKKTRKTITYVLLLQVLAVINLSASMFCVVCMLIRKDFQKISKEAKEFSIGEEKYYVLIVASAILWELSYIGLFGMISCTSALFAGIFSATLLPVTEVASVIIFHDKFTAPKALSLALSLWGFTSYFFGEYRKRAKAKTVAENIRKHENTTNENGDNRMNQNGDRLGIERNSSFV